MPDEFPTAQPPSSSPTTFNIGEEYGTAKKSLPPIKMVIPALALVALAVAGFVLTQRPHSSATGALGEMSFVEVAGQNTVMVALNLSIKNQAEKYFWIKSIQATIDTDAGPFSDQAAPASDFERYYQAFPTLKEHALSPLTFDTKIPVGGEASGTIIVSFPVTADVFNRRKSLTVKVEPYDQPFPLVLKK